MSDKTNKHLPSLSARLLILTAIFVLIAEALIFVPSIARYRKVFLEDKIEKSYLAVLALEASPDHNVDKDLERRLLLHAGAYSVAMEDKEMRVLILSHIMPPSIQRAVDLRETDWITLIMGAFDTLLQDENRILRVKGPSPSNADLMLEIVVDEEDLRLEMQDYSRRILNLSLLISMIAGFMVYLSLNWMLVRPIHRIAKSMADFRENPEDETAIIQPSKRTDEVGQAECELRAMQDQLRKLLKQKERLASIGTAVAKINHDLRNSLSKAMLISDQLNSSNDETVRNLAPMLSQTVDQAIDLCSQTMDYVADSSPRLEKELFYFFDLIEEVISHVEDLRDENTRLDNRVQPMAEAEGDITQLRRVLVNLTRNALQMGATQVVFTSNSCENGECLIDVSDNGPGMPEKAKENLFKPFEGSSRRGGTGLGLVIARDIMRHHGGDLSLKSTSSKGTTFQLKLPDGFAS